MKDLIQKMRDRVKERQRTVVLAESQDPRVLEAAAFLADKNICRIILVGNESNVRSTAQQHDINLPEQIHFFSFETCDFADDLIAHLYARRRDKGTSLLEAKKMLQNPLYQAACLIATGRSDAGVAGSVATTGKVIRAAIHSIGLRERTNTVSSTFLMALKNGKVLTYADCGVVPYPDADQLADIAVESARTHKLLTLQEPVVAMLSFSTKGSAKHERTELVLNALQKARYRAPELNIDGEFQFDAAYVPDIAQRKAPHSTVAGKANILIFPNLDAGNIAYKITERLAGAGATGPILQGLAKPMMDLSRGCKWQDIVNAACAAILMG
ncbi:MAG TPA: phosphate acetyltransferase [Balneolaceae bacterium]|nr:phosphate acetyltransferase [Balneolaceae bacterium]